VTPASPGLHKDDEAYLLKVIMHACQPEKVAAKPPEETL
jgi:hypothetical protein